MSTESMPQHDNLAMSAHDNWELLKSSIETNSESKVRMSFNLLN